MIKPQNSKIVIHEPGSWRHGCSLEGTYLPRDLTAHLKKESIFIEINLFHEFNGHGSFCEYSRIGRRVVQYEVELADIEKKILDVDELPEDHHFQIINFLTNIFS